MVNSVLEDACKEHVRNMQRSDQNEKTKKYMQKFNLKDSIANVMQNMKNDTKEDERRIPPRLYWFIQQPEYINFLQCLLEYCKELFRLESKQMVLENEAR
jgi:hypothetical protein